MKVEVFKFLQTVERCFVVKMERETAVGKNKDSLCNTLPFIESKT